MRGDLAEVNFTDDGTMQAAHTADGRKVRRAFTRDTSKRKRGEKTFGVRAVVSF